MYYRLFYWYKNAPPNRPGGKGWAREFRSEKVRDKHIEIYKPFCQEMRTSESENPRILDVALVLPPAGAVEVKL